jgi:RecJ-like exonuclease
MDVLRIPITYMGVDRFAEIPLSIECPDCKGEMSSFTVCQKCYGKGEILTEAGKDIIDFMTPIIESMIDDKLQNHMEWEIERRNRE